MRVLHRLVIAGLLALGLGAPAFAQPATQQFADRAVTAPCTAACDISVRTNGSATVAVAASGSGSGLTFVWQGQSADGTWVTLPAFNEGTQTASNANLSANGQWLVASSGYLAVRGHLTVIGGGTETFSLNASAALRSVVTTAIGNVASGSTDAGAPLKIGCPFNTTPPTVTNGQRIDCQANANGAIRVVVDAGGGAGAAVVSNNTADGQASQVAMFVASQNKVWNGTNWDRSIACPLQAAATVTAGNTTQVVALSGSTVIRVCSAQIGIATTGTYKFVSGTGSNCGTGTADITPATSLISGNVVAWGSGDADIFRAPAAAALCVTAVTGNVQVFVKYAQY